MLRVHGFHPPKLVAEHGREAVGGGDGNDQEGNGRRRCRSQAQLEEVRLCSSLIGCLD